jgi:hypothetical protein
LIAAFVSGGNTTFVTDTIGNTWTLAVTSFNFVYTAVWYTRSIATGPNTISTSRQESAALFEVTAGMSKPRSMSCLSVLDKTGSNNGTSQFAALGSGTAADITSKYVSSFMVAAVNTGTTVIATPSSWTSTNLAGNNWVAYLANNPVALPATPTFTQTSSSNFDLCVALFGFLEADATATLIPRAKPFLV